MAVELLPKVVSKTIAKSGKTISSIFGLLSFRAGDTLPTGASVSRSTVATFTRELGDIIMAYLPGYNTPGLAFSRSTTATYTAGP